MPANGCFERLAFPADSEQPGSAASSTAAIAWRIFFVPRGKYRASRHPSSRARTGRAARYDTVNASFRGDWIDLLPADARAAGDVTRSLPARTAVLLLLVRGAVTLALDVLASLLVEIDRLGVEERLGAGPGVELGAQSLRDLRKVRGSIRRFARIVDDVEESEGRESECLPVLRVGHP